jgi:hypothetical protein
MQNDKEKFKNNYYLTFLIFDFCILNFYNLYFLSAFLLSLWSGMTCSTNFQNRGE